MTLLQPGKNPLTTPKPTFFPIYHVKSPVKFQNFHLKLNILFYRLFRIIYENSRIENYNLLSPTSSQRCKLPQNYTQNKMSPLLPYFSIISLLINNLESALKPNSYVIYAYFITSKVHVKKVYCKFQGYLCTLHLDTLVLECSLAKWMYPEFPSISQVISVCCILAPMILRVNL